eukprot:SAG11_NODE_17465_length_518_cov_0.615752_1_plen_95_part_00
MATAGLSTAVSTAVRFLTPKGSSFWGAGRTVTGVVSTDGSIALVFDNRKELVLGHGACGLGATSAAAGGAVSVAARGELELGREFHRLSCFESC